MRDFEINNVGATIMWEYIKNQLEELIKIHILHKIARRKDTPPWITSDIKKLIKKRDRLYKRKKKSEDKKITEQFKVVNRTVQRELRRAYWKYVGDIVTPQENDSQYSGMKRFWTYIKHKRTDNKGIAPMRQNGKYLKS